ncbi:PEP-CTERM sorting domain-containing protein [Leptolyngbya sp. GGD]|uniref:PEP-CTERM sorting domain-containing protein n=1 Tax=Leptolyngbya sp. GGD TaxID=2997907 RepID=UPI00227ABE0A|nr:PEP-CTERM sorting domain-containing protein [Leptolyngbya sp. GGD]MCY6489298.1 PEP-CTERM sorting domain-containing protein [Leptolyngbya sp. GGD]
MSFNLSTSIQRFGLAAAGTAIATLGSIGSAQAFTVANGESTTTIPIVNVTIPNSQGLTSDAADTLSNALNLGAPNASNTILGAISPFSLSETGTDLFRFSLSNAFTFNATATLRGFTIPNSNFLPAAIRGQTIAGLVSPTLWLFRETAPNTIQQLAGGSSTISPLVLSAGNYFLGIGGPNRTPNISVAGLLLGWGGQRTNGGYSIATGFSAVPEPFTMLGGAAALGVGGMMQRKRKKRQLAAQKVD